jgi:hypothetical protein
MYSIVWIVALGALCIGVAVWGGYRVWKKRRDEEERLKVLRQSALSASQMAAAAPSPDASTSDLLPWIRAGVLGVLCLGVGIWWWVTKRPQTQTQKTTGLEQTTGEGAPQVATGLVPSGTPKTGLEQTTGEEAPQVATGLVPSGAPKTTGVPVPPIPGVAQTTGERQALFTDITKGRKLRKVSPRKTTAYLPESVRLEEDIAKQVTQFDRFLKQDKITNDNDDDEWKVVDPNLKPIVDKPMTRKAQAFEPTASDGDAQAAQAQRVSPPKAPTPPKAPSPKVWQKKEFVPDPKYATPPQQDQRLKKGKSRFDDDNTDYTVLQSDPHGVYVQAKNAQVGDLLEQKGAIPIPWIQPSEVVEQPVNFEGTDLQGVHSYTPPKPTKVVVHPGAKRRVTNADDEPLFGPVPTNADDFMTQLFQRDNPVRIHTDNVDLLQWEELPVASPKQPADGKKKLKRR